MILIINIGCQSAQVDYHYGQLWIANCCQWHWKRLYFTYKAHDQFEDFLNIAIHGHSVETLIFSARSVCHGQLDQIWALLQDSEIL